MEIADGSLVAKEEARGAVAQAFVDLGQRESNRSDLVQLTCTHNGSFPQCRETRAKSKGHPQLLPDGCRFQ